MSEVTSERPDPAASGEDSELKRSVTGRLLYFYVLGDVLGSGIYVLIGAVAGAVGGAFWLAFGVGVSIATITGLAYAELATKYPQAAGAALYVNKAFNRKGFTFLMAIAFLASSFAAAGSLATGFAAYFGEVWDAPPALLVSLLFVVMLTIINYIGITESVWINMLMTFVEVAGLIIVLVIGLIYIFQGDAKFGTLTDFEPTGSPIFALIAGVALAFFAMTGFENAANLAEETIEPSRNFPRALIGGMITAGVVYVLVSIASALVVPVKTLAGSDAALLEVIKADVLPVPVAFMSTLFAIIAMVAITNTTLVAVVTQPRILYGMAREDVVPAVFAKVHPTRRSPWVGLLFCGAIVMLLLGVGGVLNEAGFGIDVVERLALVTVVLLLAIYAIVIICALKLTGKDEHAEFYSAPRWLLYIGLLGNALLLYYVIDDDPASLLWCGGLLAVGGILFAIEYLVTNRKGSNEPNAPKSEV
jgi:amino acid transporter